MSQRTSPKTVRLAFEQASLRITLSEILPLRAVTTATKRSIKYAQIEASIREVGVIEPPVVVRIKGKTDRYQLLDGHLRIEILKARGDQDVVCLVATEDEAFTYNKRINRVATVQEHKMILKAIEKGVSEERLASALNVNVKAIKQKVRLLDGICDEVVTLLQDRFVPTHTFAQLKRLRPLRQIEVAETMIAMNKFSRPYAQSLVAASPKDQFVRIGTRPVKGLTDDQIAAMERETANLDREFRLVEQDYGTDHLDLVLAIGYLAKLLGNVRVVHYLARHHSELLAEFQKVTQIQQAA